MTISQNEYRVIGAHIPIDRNAIKGAGYRFRERFLQETTGHGKVGRQKGQHRRHIGLNHPRAFRHAGDKMLFPS